jgi:phosphohistidine phosphatase SixA
VSKLHPSGIAKHLLRLEIEPELVLCSTAERTRETFELLLPALATTPTMRLEEELYAASFERLLERIRAPRYTDERVSASTPWRATRRS